MPKFRPDDKSKSVLPPELDLRGQQAAKGTIPLEGKTPVHEAADKLVGLAYDVFFFIESELSVEPCPFTEDGHGYKSWLISSYLVGKEARLCPLCGKELMMVFGETDEIQEEEFNPDEGWVPDPDLDHPE